MKKRTITMTALLALMLMALVPVAQVEAQTVRLYMVPSEMYDPDPGDPTTTLYYGPKHFVWRWSTQIDPIEPDLPRLGQVHYGFVDGYIVAAELTQEQHDWLIAFPDSWAFPVDLDANIAQEDMEALRTRFEDFHVPADWLTASNTYREFLHNTYGVFRFAKRYTLIAGEAGYRHEYLFDTVTLDMRYRDFPTNAATWFEATIESYGYDPADVVKPNNTMRQMLKQAGDLIAAPLQIAGMTF